MNNLWDNPMIDSAKEALTEEQQREYKIIGEQVYNTINYETSQIKNNQYKEEFMLNDLIMAIKSGLKYNHLTEEEKNLLQTHYGDKYKNELFKN